MSKVDKLEVVYSGHDRKSLCRINRSAHGTLYSLEWAREEELQQLVNDQRRGPPALTTTKTRPLNTNFRCSVDHYAIWINKWRMVWWVNRTLKCSGRVSTVVRRHVHLNFSSVTSSSSEWGKLLKIHLPPHATLQLGNSVGIVGGGG